jgi:hypothetical protein
MREHMQRKRPRWGYRRFRIRAGARRTASAPVNLQQHRGLPKFHLSGSAVGPLISGQLTAVREPRWNILIIQEFLVGAQGLEPWTR